jgi:MazG family protein
VLGEEAGLFGADDVVRAMERKMWRRHPHLFPALEEAQSTPAPQPAARPGEAVHGSWERTKAAERGPDGPGVLEGLPPDLPALIMAYRLQERAAGVGFDWPDASGPAAKVREELAELEAEVARGGARESERVDHELGDLLFAVVNLARKLACDPRAALERANRRFVERFRIMEQLAAARGVPIGRASVEELDVLWEAAKTARL